MSKKEIIRVDSLGRRFSMSLEENKAVIRSLIEVENKKDLALLDDLMAPDFVDHDLQLRSLESYKQFDAKFFMGFPDCHEIIEGIIAEGDKVWARVKVTGTHKGEFEFGPIKLAPTGKKVTWKSVSIYRIVDGKVVERETVRDLLDMGLQLGFIEIKGFPSSK
jgi:predicted ester cyclase